MADLGMRSMAIRRNLDSAERRNEGEPSMRSAWNALVAEIAGTFMFFFVGIGAVASLDRAGSVDGAAGLVVVALAHGIVLAVMVSAL
jgi:hypothetical protein